MATLLNLADLGPVAAERVTLTASLLPTFTDEELSLLTRAAVGFAADIGPGDGDDLGIALGLELDLDPYAASDLLNDLRIRAGLLSHECGDDDLRPENGRWAAYYL